MAFDAKEFVVVMPRQQDLLYRPFTGEVYRFIEPIDYGKPEVPRLAMRCFVEPGVKGCASERPAWMFSGVALTDVICDRLDDESPVGAFGRYPVAHDRLYDEEPFA